MSLQYVDFDLFPAQQLLVAARIRHVTDDHAVELADVDECRAYPAGAKSGVKGCLAEILPPSVSNRRCLPVVIGIVFLHESVMPFSHDLAGLVVNDHRANGATALVVALLRQPDGNSYEIAVAQFFEETLFSNR